MEHLLQKCAYELIPLKSAEAAIAALPPAARVSVTCSPAKGIDATLELTRCVADLGHTVIPHIAARMVTGPDDVRRIAAALKSAGIRDLFLVGGDQPDPLGPYVDGLGVLRDLLDCEHGLSTIGFPSYPDGHAMIESSALHEAVHAKTRLTAEAGLATWISTQMCFDPKLIETWLRRERAAGLVAPVHLGVPGVIDKVKLMTMGARLGIGSSLRFLKKNRATMGRLLMPGGYEPSGLINAFSNTSNELNITGLHLFTFNEVEATRVWVEDMAETHTSAAG